MGRSFFKEREGEKKEGKDRKLQNEAQRDEPSHSGSHV